MNRADGRRVRGALLARAASAIAATWLLCSCVAAPVKPASAPLLEAASAVFYLDSSRGERSQADVLGSFALLGALNDKYGDANPCTQTACKRDYAEALATLGQAYSRLGLHRLSLRYYELAAASDASYRTEVAAEQLMLGRDEAALASIAQALGESAGGPGSEYQAARIYLLTGQPQEAIRHAERCLQSKPAEDKAQYCAIQLVLAKQRGGTDSMLLPLIEAKAWPGPLLAYVRGDLDQTMLARLIALSLEPPVQRERLSEALYYAGEVALARGSNDLALRYFRANQAMKVEGYWETMAARRRILQLRGNSDPPEPEVPASHVPLS